MKNWKHGTFIGLIAILALTLVLIACDNGNNHQPKTFTVTFNANNETGNTTQTITEGSKATKPENPAKGGWSFEYWFDVATNIEWDFNTAVTSDITLKAKWIIKVQNADIFRYNDLNTPFNISGTVILEIYITGSDPIVEEIGSVENGKLSFILPETLTANDWKYIYQAPSDISTTYDYYDNPLSHYRYDFTVDKDTVSLNPSDAKGLSFEIKIISTAPNIGNYYLDCYNETTTTVESISTSTLAYMYFGYYDKSSTLLGEVDTTSVWTFFNDNNRIRTRQNKTTYDWRLTQGWNIWYQNSITINDNSDSNAVNTQSTVNNSTNHSFINVANLKWVFS
jgi:hypothetical protein